jgi:SAM-dependent methyltransferase
VSESVWKLRATVTHDSNFVMSIDSVYYRDAGRFDLARKVSAAARRSTLAALRNVFVPTEKTTILDIGASDEEGPETNMLEQQYPWPASITAAGLGNGVEFGKRYPQSRYVRIEAGKPLPFPDKAFDIVWSNAVLEHLGGSKERAEFITEVTRVGNGAFIVVPNRWFPIEHHTAIPFLHWNAALFRRCLRRTRLNHWADPRQIEFLSKRMLREEWSGAEPVEIFYTGLWLGPFSSNLALVAGRRGCKPWLKAFRKEQLA